MKRFGHLLLLLVGLATAGCSENPVEPVEVKRSFALTGIERVNLTPDTATGLSGEQIQFEVFPIRYDGDTAWARDAAFVIRNTAVATVSAPFPCAQGAGDRCATVTLKASGTTRLVVTAGKSDSSVVVVGSTPPPPPPPLEGEQAFQADSFVGTMSIQTHIGHHGAYNNNWPLVKDRLLELGVRHIRQRITSLDATARSRLIELGNAGVKLTAGCWPQGGNYTDGSNCITLADAIGPSTIDAFDGWNEVDNQNLGSNWPTFFQQWQVAMYAAIDSHPVWGSRPIIASSVSHANDADLLPNLSGSMDFGNLHSYPGGGSMPSDISNAWIPKWNAVATPKPLMVTETGYHSCPTCGGVGVSELGQAKYTLRIFTEYFNRGIKRTNLYQLWNEGTSTTSREDNWGLVRFDGSRKPSFTALRDMIALLADAGPSFTPGELDLSYTGKLASTHTTLLQKRDGSFWLLIWQEINVYNVTTEQDRNNAEDDLTISFGVPKATVRQYRPRSNGVVATETASNVTSLNVSAPDDMLILEIVP